MPDKASLAVNDYSSYTLIYRVSYIGIEYISINYSLEYNFLIFA